MSLQMQQVVKSFSQPDGTTTPILDVDSFSLADGEQVVLLGESGSGKTTLLNVISGITAPDSGKVMVDGTDIVPLPEAGRDRFRAERIGIVFQTFNLLPAFSALENVLLGMSFGGGTASREKATELLKSVDLGHRLDHRPGQLSVGQQQRVAVARALANTPSLLLADEPTANVDLANRDSILSLIREACADHNISLLLVTHSEDVASQFPKTLQLSEFNRAAREKLATTPETGSDAADGANISEGASS